MVESLPDATAEMATQTISRGVIKTTCTITDDMNGLIQIPLTTALSSVPEENMRSEITVTYSDNSVLKVQFLYITIEPTMEEGD